MNKYWLLALLLSTSPAVAFAHGNGHHHDDGEDGEDGQDGVNGTNGLNGIDGRNGIDYNHRTGVGVEGVVRLYDGKRTSLELFDTYDVRARYNHFFGARFTVKIGKSYQDRRIEELERQVRILTGMAHPPARPIRGDKHD
jgi:hypothetical protein